MALKVVITQLLSTLVHKRENNLIQKVRRNYRWTFHPEEVVFYIYIYIYNAYVLLSFLVFHFTMKQGKVCPELAAVCGLTWENSDPELWLSLVIWSASPLCDFFETETQGPLLYKERWTTKKRICPPELQNLSLLGSACCGGYMRKSDHWEPWGPQDPKTPPS